jgi:hypothetical protein
LVAEGASASTGNFLFADESSTPQLPQHLSSACAGA